MEGFFYAVSRVTEEAELTDLFATRYGWKKAEIIALEVTELSGLMTVLSDKDTEERIFRQWLAILPVMYAGAVKFVPYEDFKAKLSGNDIDTRSAEEILAEANEAQRWVENESV